MRYVRPSLTSKFGTCVLSGSVGVATMAPVALAPSAHRQQETAASVAEQLAQARPAWAKNLVATVSSSTPRAPVMVHCNGVSTLEVWWQAQHTQDFAKTRGNAWCGRGIKGISVDVGAAKNGTHIPQLDTADTEEFAAGAVAPEVTYFCGNCAGQWTHKASFTFKKLLDGSQQIVEPEPMAGVAECDIVWNDRNQALGWHCLGVAGTFVP